MVRIYFFIIMTTGLYACQFFSNSKKEEMLFREVQLTTGPSGHCLNSTQVFSPTDEWIAYDARNHDTMIGSTEAIWIVNAKSGETKPVYQTTNASQWGPGVGAASFSPIEDRIIFIHGIRNARKENPYNFTRRTGVSIDISKPFIPVFYDGRDILPPFTNGALRGGTHAHTWSGDGQWLSFTYNDYIMQLAAEKDSTMEDLRTVGVTATGDSVIVQNSEDLENNNGVGFSFLIVPVVSNPRPGSDEVKKAFDETWIGKQGYLKTDGSRQRKAIAYQGHVIDDQGETKTEIFVADIPDDILQSAMKEDLRGTDSTRPKVPDGILRRRITFTENGVSNTPRHWLRSDADGEKIGFLAADNQGMIQLYIVSPNNDKQPPVQITRLSFSIQGPFNFSPNGKQVAFIADNSVFVATIETGDCQRLTERSDEASKPVGAVNWSNNGKMLAYNRYVNTEAGNFLQIFLLVKE